MVIAVINWLREEIRYFEYMERFAGEVMTEQQWAYVPWPSDCPVDGLGIAEDIHHIDDLKRLLFELQELTGYHPPVDKHLRLV